MSNIGIIGGGIIGLASAYYLRKSGHNVTVIEQSDLSDGCSLGNAGMIVPSHLIPLAAPGMISKGIRWMFNSSSPFYVKPRLDMDLIKWGLHFYKNANQAHVENSARPLKELSLLSKSMYQQLSKDLAFDFGFHERGLLMLYKTRETEHEESETAEHANRFGIEAKILSSDEVQRLEPNVKVSVRGGVYFPGDAHITPQKFFYHLLQHLKSTGTSVHTNVTVTGFELSNQNISSVITSKGKFAFDQIVIATGAWSGIMARKLALNLPMQAGKGYSFTVANVEKNTRIPSIFLEARVAVTPMGPDLRFGGTMEITGVDHTISMKRVKGIVDAIPNYYPELKVTMPSVDKVWHGLRPCSPDGLPYIGRTNKYRNVIMATGHSMLGISLGPATGKLIAEIVDESALSMELSSFNPDRYA